MASLPPPRCAISLRHRRRLVLLLVIAASTAAQAAATVGDDSDAAAAASPPANNAFLRDRCATTLYPALCYDSLLPYAGTFRTSRARLAGVAAGVAAARLRALAARVKELLHRGGPEAAGGGRPSEAAALRDCQSTVSAAASLAKQSSAELAGLDDATETTNSAGGSSSRERRWKVSNARTWLSAAMTDEGTCTDGLEEAGAVESPAGKEVAAGVATVKQFTSIALALVGGILV
ncbi:hypothetical protein ACP4OV_019249 [Aristida adscensionis]